MFVVSQDVRVYNEEAELEGRDAQQDYSLYKDTCAALATLMAEIQELKASGAKDGVSFMRFASLRVKSAVQWNDTDVWPALCFLECGDWGETQTEQRSFYYSEETQPSGAHETEERSRSDTWGM